MENETSGKYEKERTNYEYKDLINQIEKLISRIDYLYDEIDEQGIAIPERKKIKIENFIEKIRNEEISSLKLVINYKEEIIKILESLFKTPFFVILKNALLAGLLFLATPFIFVYTSIKNTKNNIANSLDESRQRRHERALEREKEREERALQKERDREERELQKQREREEKEALALQKEKEKDEKALEKQREKEERIIEKEREKEQEPQNVEETVSPFTMGGVSNLPVEEKEEIKEEKPELAAPSVAYYSPKEDTVVEEEIQDITHSQEFNYGDEDQQEEVNYAKYIIPILLILLTGLIFFLIWSNFDTIVDSMKFASIEKEVKKKVIAKEPVKEEIFGLAKCFPELTGSEDSIEFANNKLKDAYYCCFDNRITKIDPTIFSQWKQKNFELIKCISENLPDDYMLVVVGHANRTGSEEDLKIFRKDWDTPQYVVGNYTYSMERAKSLIKELNDSINKELVLYYGVGSQNPRINEGVSPEDHLNRRITFKIMKKERSEDESEKWVNKKEDVRVVK